MHAITKDELGTAFEELRARRHRPVSATVQIERPTASFDDEDRDASSIIALFADALERIVETTTDPASKAIAEESLVLFQGR
jgi:hypothetical protein